DDYFRLSKYFLQILAAVTNNNIVKDPNGLITVGQKVRVPFLLNASDIDATAILMTDVPVVRMSLETPAGHVVTATEAIGLGATVAAGSNMVYFRFALPLLAGGKAAHRGTWQVLLEIGERGTRGLDAAVYSSGSAGKAVRYSVSVHAYS